MENKEKAIKLVDKLIFVFMLIFLASLTVSIFVNQIGYYGTLLLLILRFAISRKNPFSKSGLELAFVWFLLAELISGLLSTDQSHSLNNLLRRLLLIPVVYVTVAAINDGERAKTFFKVYIIASLISIFVYLIFAYQYYLQGAYKIDWSGPSVFQFPITTSEIMSFTVVFLFAFLINEKTTPKFRLVILMGFLISAAGLVSTFKRTGWLGTAFGLLIIILIKRELRILIPAAIILTVFILSEENISEVKIFDYNGKTVSRGYTIKTEGRASDVYPDDGEIIVSDYENGLVFYKDSIQTGKLELPAPVVSYRKWKENLYIAYLIDTRIILIEKTGDELKIKNEIISPGFTVSVNLSGDYLYILDKDSGLTVFRNPEIPGDTVRYGNLKDYNALFVDSNYIVITSYDQHHLIIFDVLNGLPGKQILDTSYSQMTNNIYYTDKKILMSDQQELTLFGVNSSGLRFLDKNKQINNVIKWEEHDGKLFSLDIFGNLYEINSPLDNTIKINSKLKLNFLPVSFTINDDKLYLTKVQRNRLVSSWDSYYPTNMTRLSLWRAGWEIFKDNPLFGTGDLDLAGYYKKYKRYYDKEIQGHLHNNYIHVLATLGLFGFFAVCYLLGKILLINIRLYKRNKDVPFVSSYSLGVLGAFCAFLVSGLTELNIWDQEIITLVYFTFGLNIALNNLIKPDSKETTQ
jgi:O-antigen ligase